MEQKSCVNCGKQHDTQSILCGDCVASFPGAPSQLTDMIKEFEQLKEKFSG